MLRMYAYRASAALKATRSRLALAGGDFPTELAGIREHGISRWRVDDLALLSFQQSAALHHRFAGDSRST